MVSIEYKEVKVSLLILNFLFFGLALVFNGFGMKNALFDDEARDAKNMKTYHLDIIPASWTFSVIWSNIYIFAAALIIYSIINIFRETQDGHLYYNPDIITVPFLIFYIANWIFNSLWIVTATAAQKNCNYLMVMAAFLLLIFLSLAIGLVFSYLALVRETESLTQGGLTKDIWCIRILLHNGVSVYATWAAFATTLNFALVFVYIDGVQKETAEVVALSIITVLVLTYASLDLCMFADPWTRYVVTPHITLVLAFSGSLSRLGVSGCVNSVFVFSLLMVSVVALLVKIIVMICRSMSEMQGQDPERAKILS